MPEVINRIRGFTLLFFIPMLDARIPSAPHPKKWSQFRDRCGLVSPEE
jgi:hypothetical protein